MMVLQVTLEGITNECHVSTLHSQPSQACERLTGQRASRWQESGECQAAGNPWLFAPSCPP